MGADPLIGLRLGDYVIEDLLAAGGMGIVYRARHPVLKRAVAVKVLRQKYARDAVQMQRFLTEAQLLGALRHEGIVDVFNFGDLPDGRQYMMMELLAGETLEELLKREEKLPPRRALALVDQMLEALSAAHQAGVVHRDLKPSNIFLVAQTGGGERLKILDFGIAKQLSADEGFDPKKKASVVGGTPQYISPEQAEGLVATPRSDLYAVGGVLFQMVSGRPPFMGDEWGYLLRAHATLPAPRLSSVLPDVPRDLEALVAQLLEKKPERRPQSAGAVREQVQRQLEALPEAASVGRSGTGARTLALGFAGLAVVGMLASFVVLELSKEPAPAPVNVAAPLPRPALKPAADPAPAPSPAPAAPPAAPSLNEEKYKAAMAAALENERQMAAAHRDRELVMGIKKLTEEGMPEGREKEQVHKTLGPALASQVELTKAVEARPDGKEHRTDERLQVLRASCKRPEWKTTARAKIDRELTARLTVLTEEALPHAAERMQRLRLEADRLSRAVQKAKTVDQCMDALTDLDRWVAVNVAY